MQITISLINFELGLPVVLAGGPFKCGPLTCSKEPFLTQMVYSLMTGHTQLIRAIQSNNNPRILLAELLVKPPTSKARSFRNSRDLIWCKDLSGRGDTGKLLADGLVEFDFVRL